MKLLTKRQVIEKVGYSGQHIMRLMKEGKFPKCIKPGGVPNAKVFWLEEVVNDWINRQVEARS